MTIQNRINLKPNVLTGHSQNHVLYDFPPPDDFPMIIAPNGSVISRYCDPIWDYTIFAGKFLTINFSESQNKTGNSKNIIDDQNSQIFRKIIAYLHFGDRPHISITTLHNYASSLKSVFSLCTKSKIAASNLWRHPKIFDQLSEIPYKVWYKIYPLLHELYNARHFLGFMILTPLDIEKVASNHSPTKTKQTPYIPERIWLYQIRQTRKFLIDYLDNRERFEALFDTCLSAYIHNCGSIENTSRKGALKLKSPFSKTAARYKKYIYLGRFPEVARKFGVADVLEKWMIPENRSLGDIKNESAKLLSKYFTTIGFVGSVYLANFSGMRRSEVGRLRTKCLEIDHDEVHGDTYLLRGPTAKTVDDENALWITSPTSKLAIEAMTSVARLRMKIAKLDSRVPKTQEDIDNPYLVVRAYEPWGMLKNKEAKHTESVRRSIEYSSWRQHCPRLFDSKEITITTDDLQIARFVTPSLDEEKFSVGKEWSFSMHQLRRTLSVNATYSGLVSTQSIQYELKHQSSSMARYYGKNFSRLSLNSAMRTDFMRTTFEALALKARTLLGPDFISPLGDSHKVRLLEFISEKDLSELIALAKKGKLSLRETLMGVCMSREACEYGGIESLTECTQCDKGLANKKNRGKMVEIGKHISSLIIYAPPESPLRASLEAQNKAVQEMLNVINLD